ncbi:MAG TPA: hypothetical protein VGF23_11270 [Gaiellaceae bacterium]|jgi:hypothetical protein
MELWEVMAAEATDESRLWADALLPSEARDRVAVFSPLGQVRYALGLETIYEGYLLHYGRSRLFAPADADTALLLGDYLYAHGLVRIAEEDSVAAVSDLAELISLSAQLQAEGTDGDGALWAATAAVLGAGELEPARSALRLHGDHGPLEALARSRAAPEPLEQALAAHSARLR